MPIIKYILLIIAVFFGFPLLVLILSAVVVDRTKKYTGDSPYYRFLMYRIVDCVILLGHLRVELSGREKLPAGRFLLVSNHRSACDPFVTTYMLKDRQLSYISKEENFHIPIAGKLLLPCCCLSIDRENPRNALVTVNAAAELLKNDTVSMVVYPEGTRSKDCTLLPFHSSVFKIAQRAGVPIVVMTVEGAEKARSRAPFRSTQVQLRILKTLDADHVKKAKTAELSEEIRALMEEALSPSE